MRLLFSCFLTHLAIFVFPDGPVYATPHVAPQEQSIIDDGPHVLWDGNIARVHCLQGGAHTVETYKAPLSLPLGESAPHKLLLHGGPYPEPEYDMKEPARIFAISDVHGVFDVMRSLLVGNGVIDARGRWTFGGGHLVILGDVADRGNRVTQTYWFIRALEDDARKAGGRVHMVLGNHETMIMTGDYRSVNRSYLNQPVGMPPLDAQYGMDSELGRWLRSRPLMLKLGRNLFVHGGISPEFLARGLDIPTANRGLRLEAVNERNGLNTFLLGAAGPLWFRGLVLGNQHDSISEQDLDKALVYLKVKRIVVGHTTMDKVTSLHGGRVLAIDAGIQHRRGEGLYIENGKAFRALADGSKIGLT